MFQKLIYFYEPRYKIKMRNNKKLEEFTPWQTQQQAMFTSKIFHQAAQNVNKQEDLSKQLVQQKSKQRPQILPRKRITSIYSILRLKTEKNLEQSEQKSLKRKRKQSSPVREVKPMNTNLISIINTYQQVGNRMNPQSGTKKPHNRKFLKQHSRLQKITSNFSFKTPQIPQHPVIDIKKLKQSLFQKKNLSLQTLFKARQQLQKMQDMRQSPILRTYSVQNIKLNAIEQKNKTIQKVGSLSARKQSRNEFNPFNSTISKMRQAVKSNQNGEVRPRLKSCVNLDSKKHIIDRLYDKFY